MFVFLLIFFFVLLQSVYLFLQYACLLLLAGAFALFLTRGEPLIDLYLHEGGETGDIALTMQYAKEYLAISLIGIVPFAVKSSVTLTTFL